jgi:transcriptional regulator with XRE-family HTH domain
MEERFKGIMLPVFNSSPLKITQAIAARLKAQRLREGWSRETLATRAGISQWTLKHFESSGQIALGTLVKVALVFNEADGFAGLFPTTGRMPATMAELDKLYPPPRKRGRTLR